MRILCTLLVLLYSAFLTGCANTSPVHTSSTNSILQQELPLSIRVPDGHRLLAQTLMEGTITMLCAALPSKNTEAIAYDWVVGFTQGTFRSTDGVVGEHSGQAYTWSVQGLRIIGTPVAYWNGVDHANAPWMLLKRVDNPINSANHSWLADAHYIQRINTDGGAYPVTPCNKNFEGFKRTLPYKAEYIFWS